MSREHAMVAVTKMGEVSDLTLLQSNHLSTAALPDSKDSMSLLNVYISWFSKDDAYILS